MIQLITTLAVAQPDGVAIDPDVVYGHKDGMALTFDVLRPAIPNGAGVLYIPTGGWYSGWVDPAERVPGCRPWLDRGFTVFVVYHGSAPRYNIPEEVEDVRRCVRFVRLHAGKWGVDPERLGVTGSSAGGHLTLMLATTGDDGNPEAEDVVLRQPSRIAAAVAVCPPTDIRTWLTDAPEPIRSIEALKPPLTFDPALGGDYSPAVLVTERTPPTLLIHGDADPLVPIQHSEWMLAAMKQKDVTGDLVVIPGAVHGFTPEQGVVCERARVAWFEQHLGR